MRSDGLSLVELSKAMSPNKLAAFRRARSRPGDAGEYARLRMRNYLRGVDAHPDDRQMGRMFRETVRSASSAPKAKARMIAGSSNNSAILGRPARPLP